MFETENYKTSHKLLTGEIKEAKTRLIHLLPYSFEQTRPALTKGKTLAATTTARRIRLCRRPSQSGACLLESSCIAIRGVSSKSSICSQSQVAGVPLLPRARWSSSCRRCLSPSVAVISSSLRASQSGESPSPRAVRSPRRKRAASCMCSAAVILSPSSVAIRPPQRSKEAT
ncbi:uncharacterized protein LOC107636649 [Arachis ipaensis]|uniref:uncharacterized protein LOC107636649 n=1 Tax=Arachis ipaensis TaxID=130454 RepID=UPI0007AF525C|nr:uncharacterized protein LOC107636649 [Arachis ipaensis]